MRDMPSLPNLDNFASVLEVSEVNSILAQIVTAAEANPAVSSQDAVDLMVDAIFAQGYRPDERLDEQLSVQVFHWIQAAWATGDVDFAKSAISVLANLNCRGVAKYLRLLLESDQRQLVQDEIRNCLRERGE
jgi:hypothetical protein